MQASSAPTPLPAVWANAASSPYVNPIPVPSQQSIKAGAASFTDGFPPLCFVPFATGGAGPFGSDFNGILAQVTAGLQWSQAGNFLPYSGTYSAIIGGYASGAIVQSAAVPGKFWRSTADNNASDPDTGGANWVVWTSAGALLSTQSFASSGTYNPTTSNVRYVRVRGCGPGGAGGGSVANSSSDHFSVGGGGGAGAYAEMYLGGPFGGTITGGLTVTVPGGGTGNSGAAGNPGGNGSGVSAVFGPLTVPYGTGGQVSASVAAGGATTAAEAPGGATPATTAGVLVAAMNGYNGANGLAFGASDAGQVVSGVGANGPLGAGGGNTNSGTGGAATGYGAGGGGAASYSSGSTSGANAGGAGAPAYFFVEEYA